MKILIVDDDRDVADSLADLMRVKRAPSAKPKLKIRFTVTEARQQSAP
jgi:hypothetical protein